MTRKEYIAAVAMPAVLACRGTGLFPSLMIAQAVIESGDGKSTLAAKYNNHFGIKADKSWRGDIAALPTREVLNGKSVIVNARFRAYPNIQEGFVDRCDFLMQNPRYEKAGVFSAKTPEGQALAFRAAGYATDPNYAKLLISVINGSANLKQYDIL